MRLQRVGRDGLRPVHGRDKARPSQYGLPVKGYLTMSMRPGMPDTRIAALAELTAITGVSSVTVPAVKSPVPLDVTKLNVARS